MGRERESERSKRDDVFTGFADGRTGGTAIREWMANRKMVGTFFSVKYVLFGSTYKIYYTDALSVY